MLDMMISGDDNPSPNPLPGGNSVPPYVCAPLSPAPKTHNERVPSLATLAASFRSRGDGTVQVFGRSWLVTHPLVQMGLATYNAEKN